MSIKYILFKKYVICDILILRKEKKMDKKYLTEENYQKSKRPINSKLLSFDEIKNTTNRVGWWVPKEYVVIDITQVTKCECTTLTVVHILLDAAREQNERDERHT